MVDSLKTKIVTRVESMLDDLQSMLENQEHLANVEDTQSLIDEITIYWSILSDEDQDFIEAAKYVVNGQTRWIM